MKTPDIPPHLRAWLDEQPVGPEAWDGDQPPPPAPAVTRRSRYTPYAGVSPSGSPVSPWRASVTIGRECIYLGSYKTEREAAEACALTRREHAEGLPLSIRERIDAVRAERTRRYEESRKRAAERALKRRQEAERLAGLRQAERARVRRDRGDARQFLEDRLIWLYGGARAAEIMAGRDPATQADIAAWRRLGTPKAVRNG